MFKSNEVDALRKEVKFLRDKLDQTDERVNSLLDLLKAHELIDIKWEEIKMPIPAQVAIEALMDNRHQVAQLSDHFDLFNALLEILEVERVPAREVPEQLKKKGAKSVIIRKSA